MCGVCCSCAHVPMCSGLASHAQVGTCCALQPLQLFFQPLACLFTYRHISTACKVMAVVRKMSAGEDVEGMHRQEVGQQSCRGHWGEAGMPTAGVWWQNSISSGVVTRHGAAQGSCAHAGSLCHSCSSSSSICCCHGPRRLSWPETGTMSYTDDTTSTL